MSKKQIIMVPNHTHGVMTLDGKKYRYFKSEYTGADEEEVKVTFMEISDAVFNKTVKELSKYLVEKSGLTVDQILENVLSEMQYSQLLKIKKLIRTKHPKVTKEDGCLSLIVGPPKRGIKIEIV